MEQTHPSTPQGQDVSTPSKHDAGAVDAAVATATGTPDTSRRTPQQLDVENQQELDVENQQRVLDELVRRIGAVEDRLDALEARLTQIEQTQSAPDPETLMTIAAAAAAYLGVKGKVRAIRYAAPTRWAQVGRDTVHRHTAA